MKRIFILILAFIMLISSAVSASPFVELENWSVISGDVANDNSDVAIGAGASAELSFDSLDVSESGSVSIEMKMTVDKYGRSVKLPEFFGKTSSEGDAVSVASTQIAMTKLFTIGSKSTGVKAVEGTTYIMKYTFDFLNNSVKLAVYDEEGNLGGESSSCNFSTGTSKVLTLEKMVFTTVSPLEVTVSDVKVSDGSFKIMSLNVSENDVVPIDKDIIFKLNGAADESTLNNISVMCGEDSVTYEISKNESGEYVMYFPYGLSYNTDYVLTIPKTVLSDGDGLSLYERVVNFKTEMHPYYVKNIALSATDLSGKTSVSLNGTFVNYMSADVDSSVIVLIYNTSGEIVKSYYKLHTATKGGESTVSDTIDLSGTTNAKTAKIYVWNNLFGMNDVIIAD